MNGWSWNCVNLPHLPVVSVCFHPPFPSWFTLAVVTGTRLRVHTLSRSTRANPEILIGALPPSKTVVIKTVGCCVYPTESLVYPKTTPRITNGSYRDLSGWRQEQLNPCEQSPLRLWSARSTERTKTDPTWRGRKKQIVWGEGGWPTVILESSLYARLYAALVSTLLFSGSPSWWDLSSVAGNVKLSLFSPVL